MICSSDFTVPVQIKGERLVLNANGSNGTLATCALRPSGIFGPGDLFAFPTIAEKASAGKLRFIIGSGKNVMEFTYVENVAQAHLQVFSRISVLLLCKQAYRLLYLRPVRRLQAYYCASRTCT